MSTLKILFCILVVVLMIINVCLISFTKVMHGVVVAERLFELMSLVMEVRTGKQLMYWSQMKQNILGHGAGPYGLQKCQCLVVSWKQNYVLKLLIPNTTHSLRTLKTSGIFEEY